jgi:hypothetical protein
MPQNEEILANTTSIHDESETPIQIASFELNVIVIMSNQ